MIRPTSLHTCLPQVARHRFAREGRTQVLRLLWLNHEGVRVGVESKRAWLSGGLAQPAAWAALASGTGHPPALCST